MIKYTTITQSLILQWHITEKCNFMCKHCYKEHTYKKELSFEELYVILHQYLKLTKTLGIPKQRAMINFTGGEPFARKDFIRLLEKIQPFSRHFRWGVLSNGSLITQNLAKKLKKIGLEACQISLEGTEKTNDSIRGKGSFQKAIKGIRILTRNNIKTVVSLTLSKKNIDEISNLVRFLGELGISKIGTRRLVPIGRGKKMEKLLLEPKQLKEYYDLVKNINSDYYDGKSNILIDTGCESSIYNKDRDRRSKKRICGVKTGRIITLMPNGDVLPCRRLPIILGNVKKTPLDKIYSTSKKYKLLRDLNNNSSYCKTCENYTECYGGAFCVNYACTKKLFIPDIQCWRHNKAKNYFRAI